MVDSANRITEILSAALREEISHGGDLDSAARAAFQAIYDGGYRVELSNPCRCGCGRPRTDHLCPCGCGHTYEDAVRKVMSGPMFLNWEQASGNIDDHPHVPCKWPT